ncbi:hypothetical protein CU097_003419 [Rhizopus azygosporus]|uniref:Uncharacterized protein n=1 Tax=Rhizopus azygosporus TaxID=86630 RepID=A0A367J0F8_RHIAZ|nr:hypothetical protein CU097_003419 [Rhizopus azygosporus]
MSFSNIIARENDISIPKPIPTTERHSIGANSNNTSISHNRMIELYIEHDKEKKDIMVTNAKKEILYYYNKQDNTIHDNRKTALWRLIDKDWHKMILKNSGNNIEITLSTEEFNFTYDKQLYQWRLIPTENDDGHYILNCYSSTHLIAQLNRSVFYIESCSTTNPFKLFNPFFTFILFSALIINETIVKNLLRSIGNDSAALKSILDFKRPYSHISHNNDNDDDNDAYSYISTINTTHSIEISPSIWNWCHRLWWSCFPCCMPGGCCDRVRLKLNPFSRKGWQQQHY